MSDRTWDIGDTVPPIDVTDVSDYTADTWGRVSAPDPVTGEAVWKSCKNGGNVYLAWSEMVRRWGPVTEVRP